MNCEVLEERSPSGTSEESMHQIQPTVYIADENSSTAERIAVHAEELGLRSDQVEIDLALPEIPAFSRPGCLILDIREDEQPAALDKLFEIGNAIPVILTTSRNCTAEAIRLMEDGAFTILQKPYSVERLAEAINAAVQWDNHWHKMHQRLKLLRGYERTLSPQERRVLTLVSKGVLNKVIARRLDLSVRMIETHRARLLKKFEAGTAPELAAKYSELQTLTSVLTRFQRPVWQRNADVLASNVGGCE